MNKLTYNDLTKALIIMKVAKRMSVEQIEENIQDLWKLQETFCVIDEEITEEIDKLETIKDIKELLR